MKKITEPFQRKGKTGWWLRWYEQGRQVHRSFNTRKEAEHYRHYQYMRLNNDVYTAISLPFDDAKKEYLIKYDVEGLTKYSKSQADKIITKFFDACRPLKTGDITQKMIDYYALKTKTKISEVLKTTVSSWSVNRELRTLRTFFLWCKKRGYIQSAFEYPIQKTMQPKSKALSDDQIKNLLKSCPSDEWRLRILLGLTTGLRKVDLYRLKTADIDLKNGTVSAQERKTGKRYSNYIPDKLMPLILAHTPSEPYFFKVVNIQWLDKQFRLFRPDKAITIQSLRKTFATRIETTGISTTMLNHSGAGITRQFYNDLDYIKYIRVNQLPIDLWLE